MFPPGIPLSKRLFDLLATSLGTLLISPILLLLALWVRVAHGSPVLFKQRRPGYRGKPFTLYKFRSMTDTCDAQGNLLPDAERLTRLGRFLRATSLDELPELLNVLRGEMSLVGPRPLLMQYLERYTTEQARRHNVLPGMTGWAQINGRNLLTWEDRFRLDVWYVDHRSLWLDIKILALTLWKAIQREGISPPGQEIMPEFLGSPPPASPAAGVADPGLPAGTLAGSNNAAIDEYWQAFCRQNRHLDPGTPYQAWHFGDNRELADELCALVLTGRKTATASLAWESELKPDEAAQVGDFSVITDFNGRPRCIIQTIEVCTLPFDEVDAQFAAEEGEGDLSLEYWRQAHWNAFSRACARIGRSPELKMPVECERFRLVFPPPPGSPSIPAIPGPSEGQV